MHKLTILLQRNNNRSYIKWGYGHIAPRTDWGKVTTIFYAILGIPLMLLCLSNIGDVMASSFRFLYWKVCCYACTRPPPRRRQRLSRCASRQMSHRYSSRSQPPPSNIRRSIRISQRSTDSGFVPSNDTGLIHAYSDPELRRYNHNHLENSIYNQHISDSRLIDNARITRNDRTFDYKFSHEHEIDNYKNRNYIRNNDNNNQTLWQPKSPNVKRFSNRNRNRERIHGSGSGRYSAEYDDRNWNNSLDDLDIQNTKRAYSSRSLRDRQSIGREININTTNNSAMNINRINSKTISPSSNTNRYKSLPKNTKIRSKSVEPKLLTIGDTDNTPIFCNRYALERRSYKDRRGSRGNIIESNFENRQQINNDSNVNNNSRCLSVPIQRIPLYGDRLEIPKSNRQYNRRQSYHYIEDYNDNHSANDYGAMGAMNNDEFEMKPIKKENNRSHFQLYGRKEKPVPLPPSPRIMSPMGFAVHRQARLSMADDDDSYYDEEWDSYGDLVHRNRPVPIWLCVFLVISYIIAGAFLFSNWEKWPFLDSVYFCFITLTTIGFGDFVPAQGVKENSKESIALCSLYLLFGISLLAMSFNLVQEEVITNVKEVARRLGILKEEEIDD